MSSGVLCRESILRAFFEITSTLSESFALSRNSDAFAIGGVLGSGGQGFEQSCRKTGKYALKKRSCDARYAGDQGRATRVPWIVSHAHCCALIIALTHLEACWQTSKSARRELNTGWSYFEVARSRDRLNGGAMKKPINKFAVALWVLAVALILGTAFNEYGVQQLYAHRAEQDVSLYEVVGSGWRLVTGGIAAAAQIAGLGVLIELVDQIRWNALNR